MAGDVSFNTSEWDALFRSIDKTAKDPKPALRVAFGTRGFRDIISHFDSEASPTSPWRPSQRVLRYGGKTLQDTGNLRQNFIPTNLRDRGRDAIVFFNPTPYADQHDSGTKTIPQREFMWLSGEAQEDMLNIILDLIVK